MAREYTVPMSNVTLANQAVTLVFVNPGTTCSLEFFRFWVSQSGTATSAQIRVQVNSQVTAFPTLTSQTPQKLKMLDPASQIIGGTAGAAGTSGVNASAEGAGTKTILWPDSWNNINGYLLVPNPFETFTANAGAASGIGLHLPAAPTNLAGYSAGCTFRELG